ncbi:MAG: tRNA A64-2'-O-ribosylphosphate transferase [Benniella sp.]|nr:MAG: tRNA A64-2'-O-ribosylphosphate transferase [Benniella sp.]
MNRLRSIQADAAFVSEIADLFPQFPVFANERCGTWYVHPSKIHRPGVYFKSTDGHTGRWDFNLRRYNPHLITAIINHGGCIVVDSTRKGKRIPDALSKTIPIWCATINTAVRKCALRRQEAQAQQQSESQRWDTRYHSLPSLISRSEHEQIAEKIDGFSERLLRFTDLAPLTTRLLKPIRPIWLTPQSLLLKDYVPDYDQVAFFPVICLSASRVVPEGMEECNGYLYVQGSGDDEEMWSKGLTPDLFWENEHYLLEGGISPAKCEARAQEIVQEAKRKLNNRGSGNKADITDDNNKGGLQGTGIWIGNNASARIPDSWEEGFDMVINCAAEIRRDIMFEGSEESQVYHYLHLPIAEGKKGQRQLLEMIPFAIKAVESFYASRATQEADGKACGAKILIHCQQGMDRSVGIALALLVSCFDEETGGYIRGSRDKQQTTSKEAIQRRLFQIMSHRLAARPSRATLKMVNTYFMSPTDPPPAKYKQQS